MAPKKAPVWLIDSHAYLPPKEYAVRFQEVIDVWQKGKRYTDKEIDFIGRVSSKSGLAHDGTYLPPAIHPRYCGNDPKTGLNEASEEAHLVLCGALQGLMAKTGITPKDIDILITTCSIYCPTPSMCSLLVNHFKMKDTVQSYHLGGMGCANGVVSVNLVADILQAHPNANAVLLTTEVTTPAFYPGHDTHRMVTNVLFRMGAAAVLLSSNTAAWAGRAKYELTLHHRVHVGQSDEAYTAIRYSPDSEGIQGIYLGKNVVTEASRALTKAMWAAGPHVLSMQQKAEFAANWVARKIFKKKMSPYTPRFSGVVQHFLLHAGGAKVLDGLGKALQLTDRDLKPSRTVLHDYGNVSSSTTWYTLGYVETVDGVKKGDKVLQVGVGSGVKCGVNVWKALRNINDVHEAWQHRATPQALARAQAKRPPMYVDVSHARMHLTSRAAFLSVMLVVVGAFHLLMLLSNSTSPPSLTTFVRSSWQALSDMGMGVEAQGQGIAAALSSPGLAGGGVMGMGAAVDSRIEL